MFDGIAPLVTNKRVCIFKKKQRANTIKFIIWADKLSVQKSVRFEGSGLRAARDRIGGGR